MRMAAKVTLTVTRGEKQGETHEYTEISRVLIGRQDDCDIMIPERTVSRYHCLLEISPPRVRLQDFGSLNGTFLSGRKIGQRDRDISWEEAKDLPHEVFELKDGDVLGLGSQCEITCRIQRGEVCALCGKDLPDMPADDQATILISEQSVPIRMDGQGRRICESCFERLQKEKARADKLEREKQAEKERREREERQHREELSPRPQEAAVPDGQKKCAGCGRIFVPTAPDNNMCPSCLANRAKVLDGVMAMLNINARKAQQKTPAGQASILAGYEKISLLGKGGMGEVWKVRSRDTGELYALKTMLQDVAMDDQAKKLFLREAGICERLRHPNVVKAYETGSANNVLYILMDLCEGGSADDLMKKKGGRLPLELAAYIILQCLSGLDYVHNMDLEVEIAAGKYQGTREISVKGLVHRDFKPGNIFLSDTGSHPTAMVADFGMAKAFQAAGKSQISKTGAVMGTPVFMPKQQARDCKYAKPEVDIWAAAASFYYMVTGTFAKNFRPGVNVWQVLIAESAVPIRKRDPSVPKDLAEVIDRALAESPGLYYSSAAQLRRDLAAALPGSVRAYCEDIL